MRVRFTDVNGVRTRYLYEGSGEPLLLVHGFACFADVFYRNIDALAQRYAVLAPDIIGHGYTAPVVTDAPIYPVMVRHLASLLHSLGVHRFHLLGWSMGAVLAGELYFSMPDRVSNLVLISSGSTFSPEERIGPMLPRTGRRILRDLDDSSLEGLRAWYRAQLSECSPTPEEVLLDHLTSRAQPGVREFFQAMADHSLLIEASRPYRLLHRMERITVPTLVAIGRDDPATPLDVHEDAARRVPQGRLAVFDRAGHLPFYERPDEFNRAVLEFLAGPD